MHIKFSPFDVYCNIESFKEYNSKAYSEVVRWRVRKPNPNPDSNKKKNNKHARYKSTESKIYRTKLIEKWNKVYN